MSGMDRPFAAYKGDEPYIFVSYSHEDAGIVYKELQWLRNLGYNIWYDEGISPGSTWRQELAEALKNCSLFLLFVTPSSAASDNCLKEVNYALDEGCPLLAVHLKSTHLSEGLKLSLSDRQAILKYELSNQDYQHKVTAGIGDLVAFGVDAVPAPTPSGPPTAIYAAVAVLLAVVISAALYFVTQSPSEVPPLGDVQAPALADVIVPPTVEAAKPREPAIAVLPFVNRSNDSEQEFFSDGLSEDLLNGLAKSSTMKVIARTSSFQFKDSNRDVREIGEVLGVTHVLEGSVRKSGNRIRVTAQLVSADDGSHLWSESYDRDLLDVFAVQDEITNAILMELDQHFMEPGDGVRVPTTNTAAYNAYLYGRQKISMLQFDEAIDALEQAVILDPEYAAPYADIAYARSLKVWFLIEPMNVGWPSIQEYTSKALALEPGNDRARRMAAVSRFYVDRDYQGAIDELHPLLKDAHGLDDVAAYAVIMQTLGRFDDAVRVYQHGVEVDPLSPRAHWQLGEAYALAGQFGLAKESLLQAERLGLPASSQLMGLAMAAGDEALARDVMSRPTASWGNQLYFRWGFEARIARQNGDEDSVRKIVAQMKASPVADRPNIRWDILYLEGDLDGVMAHWRRLVEANEFLPMRSLAGSALLSEMNPEVYRHPGFQELRRDAGLDTASIAALKIAPLPF
jgi:TolB-like protein